MRKYIEEARDFDRLPSNMSSSICLKMDGFRVRVWLNASGKDYNRIVTLDEMERLEINPLVWALDYCVRKLQ